MQGSNCDENRVVRGRNDVLASVPPSGECLIHVAHSDFEASVVESVTGVHKFASTEDYRVVETEINTRGCSIERFPIGSEVVEVCCVVEQCADPLGCE